MTTTASEREQAQMELRAAESAIASFDESRLIHEDSSPNVEAQAELARMRARLEVARAHVAALD